MKTTHRDYPNFFNFVITTANNATLIAIETIINSIIRKLVERFQDFVNPLQYTP